jgi:hypothetical protein
LFDVIQTHYQALLDALFVSPRDTSGFSAAVKQLQDHFRAIMATDVTDKVSPAIALYRIERNVFRDYFRPTAATDFKFSFFSSKSSPAGDGPKISFRAVVKKRREQLDFLDDLRAGPHPPAKAETVMPAADVGWRQQEPAAAQPDPPRLHDNASWQLWARKMWDTAEMSKPVLGRPGVLTGKLDDICHFISSYFRAFTAHVPYDLAEGSGEANYLTRAYPRAITGGLVHDCNVYAVRWIFMLGRLFAPPTMPPEISKPRIFVIEMPAHVGVMIRFSVRISGEVVIAINNQDVAVTSILASVSDSEAAEEVVKGMYPGLKTAIAIRELKANPTNATALWNEIAKLSDKKLKLPYDDPSEPFLDYLRFNAQNAAIANDLAEKLGERWRSMQQTLDAAKAPDKRRAAVKQELKAYRIAIGPLFEEKSKDFDAKTIPLAATIKSELDKHLDKVPKSAIVVEAGSLTPGWKFTQARYLAELTRIETLRDISASDLATVDPDKFFPQDSFPPDMP